MVKTINEHNIPNDTCVKVKYSPSGQEHICLWNYRNDSETAFTSPNIGYSSSEYGSFRFHEGCVFIRLATLEEKKELQEYLDFRNINFKIPLEHNYELW